MCDWLKFGVSREVMVQYVSMIEKWNRSINLVSHNDFNNFYQRHILDSLQVLNFINNKDISVIDVGSGSGLPGVLLSFAGITNVTLIESDSRKAAFLFEVSKLSSNKIDIINDRVEKIDGLKCDILTSRAFANISSLLKYTKKIEVKDKFLLHKGSLYKKELTNAKKDWLFEEKVHDSITSIDGKIIEIEKLKSIR